MLFFRRAISKRIDYYKLKSIETANITFDTIFKTGLLFLFLFTIVWIAIFLYVVFYYTYVPSIEHVKTVNLQFTACEGDELSMDRGVCSFPTAHVELTKSNQLLMLGQPYKITLFLEVPESDPNKLLGMFMVCGQLMDKKGTTVAMACRSTMLRYRSLLLRHLTTLTLAPLYVFNYLEEKQIIQVELFSQFEDDQNFPVTEVVIELKSPKVQVYQAHLQIDAHLSGLRYLMYHWPTFSATIGVTFNLTVLLFITALSWWQLTGLSREEGSELLYKTITETLSPVFKSKIPFYRSKGEEREEKILTLRNSSDSEEDEPKKMFIELRRDPSSSEA